MVVMITDQLEPESERTKEIPLTQGKAAMVDAEDLEWLAKLKWHAHKGGRTWYARCTIKTVGMQRTQLMHRAILEHHGYDLIAGVVDHINGDGLDNRKSNLQIITHAENIQKCRIQENNKSGYRGVSWHRRDSRWRAYIEVNRVRKYLGSFKTKIAAAHAYNDAAYSYFGRFARLNFPNGQNEQMMLNQFAVATR